ncbi:hypothetical protein MMC17_006061 [Xylographa soralifera]|nr:hypothetical protein [Xylographa soralifera]
MDAPEVDHEPGNKKAKIISEADIDRPHIDRPHIDRPHIDRPHIDRPHIDRPHIDRPHIDRPHIDRPHIDRPHIDRPHIDSPIIGNLDALLASPDTLYFAYGSNLSLLQMQARCPSSRFLGVGLLTGWKWIINKRGYANIVAMKEASSAEIRDNVIYGLVYALSPTDEDSLDVYEGVPEAHTKEKVSISIWPEGKEVLGGAGQEAVVLVYVDRKRVEDGIPKLEYVQRMRRGMLEAGEKGVPELWMRSTFSKWLDVS